MGEMTDLDFLLYAVGQFWPVFIGFALAVVGPGACVWLAGRPRAHDTLCGIVGAICLIGGITVVIGAWQW